MPFVVVTTRDVDGTWPRQRGTMVRILKRAHTIADHALEDLIYEDPNAASGLEDMEETEAKQWAYLVPDRWARSNLLLRSSRGGSGLFLRTSRNPEAAAPLSLRNGLLLRSFKRAANGLFLRTSKANQQPPKVARSASNGGLFLRSF